MNNKSIYGLSQWVKDHPNKSIYVMVRLNFQTSFPCKITRQEWFKFYDSLPEHTRIQSNINDNGHLIVGL